ncbi:hypothetical protein AC482_04180 [miscellaneous Crenarchaeota group-15 archaeon DG-45]|uniref:formylmethanofuran dehydrogenase n=1 Tax=miscellaneous Crenarchaeota group-15 archaeon DG-45 TaxID=1685127 RepID=A0A0M0BPJ8_9ARCH|nr:MAG: hypothetical protein AC482_04180 [miscellaneous Crenarchaeota group-15 archaeon DG-45]
MRALRLRPKGAPSIPVEAEAISPDIVAGKALPEIEKLVVHVGNTTRPLGDFFDVEGEVAELAAEQLIIVEGGIPWAKYIGASMTGGRIIVEGDAGMHAGSQMSGGEITVEGSASDWAGAEMRGGLLRIGGDAGDLLGAAYRGSSEGMTGGCIIVEGRAGLETGSFMRRGMVVVLGDVGPFAGAHMNGGEIFVFGRAARRLGAEMRGNGGVIVCLGEVEALLPTFVYDATYRPTFMKLYLRELRDALGVREAGKFIDSAFRRYRGDAAVGGDGEILIAERQGGPG